MLSFFPGPSKVYPDVQRYLTDAFAEGILSIPHRGAQFEALSRKVSALVKRQLNVPEDYTVLFTSSATECFELLEQSYAPHKSLHFFNGSFGEKWHTINQNLYPEATDVPFGLNEVPDAAKLPSAQGVDLVCLTHNETSNGTQLTPEFLLSVRSQYPKALLAIDATSSMGGLNLRINKADIWFASVQKCFGLPAGLGVMLCSPVAVARAKELNIRKHYNSLAIMLERALNFQTYNTPNVLNIYLLSRVLEANEQIRTIERSLVQRAKELYAHLQELPQVKLLVENQAVQSQTVLALQAEERFINTLHQKAQQNGLLLGKGYGKWAKNTFRIANFPQHTDADFDKLLGFLRTQCS